MMAEFCLIEITREKEFITYGVGVSLMTMRHPSKARGRVPVATNSHATETSPQLFEVDETKTQEKQK